MHTSNFKIHKFYHFTVCLLDVEDKWKKVEMYTNHSEETGKIKVLMEGKYQHR